MKRTISGLRNLAGRASGVGRAGGFTLVEVLVAVGAIAIVSVGLAAIFRTIGETVTQGQKVSALTQRAAVLEQQLRRDFASMTREGFLVIRHQFAGPRDPQNAGQDSYDVQINKDDGTPRKRRVDEILFFTKGEYESGREPMNAAYNARSDTAMVYYGQAVRPRKDLDANGNPVNDRDFRPSVSNINNADPMANANFARGNNLEARGLGGTLGESFTGQSLPNTYASSWTLLRKQTLLAAPKTTRENFPTRGWPQQLRAAAMGVAPISRLSENEVQIAAQPAASHIFRSLARVVSVIDPNASLNGNGQLVRTATGQGGDTGAAFPQLSSGLVDIATTDLNEIRSLVQTFEVAPTVDPAQLLARYRSVTFANPGGAPNANWDGTFRSGAADLARMHAWMEDAFPTQSDRFGLDRATDPRGTRVRFEDAPPDYLNVLTDMQNGTGEQAVAFAGRRADQTMLTHGAVLPKCTEFIVEWSFGETTTSGGLTSLVWYGQTNANGESIKRYSSLSYRPFQGRVGYIGTAASHQVNPQLIYGTLRPDTQTQTAHFGYYDPFWNSPGVNEPDSPVLLPWAWPKLVRITAAMVDDRDPLKEERFQWVFELPGTPNPQ